MTDHQTTFEPGDCHYHGETMELFQPVGHKGERELQTVVISYLKIESASVDEDGDEQYQVGHYGPLGRRKAKLSLTLEDLEEFGFEVSDMLEPEMERQLVEEGKIA